MATFLPGGGRAWRAGQKMPGIFGISGPRAPGRGMANTAVYQGRRGRKRAAGGLARRLLHGRAEKPYEDDGHECDELAHPPE
jgi:hypothetical protein